MIAAASLKSTGCAERGYTMGRKFAFIGAGSFGFTRDLTRDILSYPALSEATPAPMDINQERLTFITRAVERIIEAGGHSEHRKTPGVRALNPPPGVFQREEEVLREPEILWNFRAAH